MTHGLRERAGAAGGARVVNTSSDAHKGRRLDFDDLQSAKRYKGFPVYGRSKLCNILFTRELARRWRGTGVTANCLHPGFVATRFGDGSGGFFERVVGIAKNLAIKPAEGAKTIVHLASSDPAANVTGAYFYKCREAEPSKEAQHDEAAKRLWDESVRLAS